MFNSENITIYNIYVDGPTHSQKYQRTQVTGVEWQGGQGARKLQQGGMISENTANIFIPLGSLTNFVDEKTWQALTVRTGKWTLQKGDFIVRGLVIDEIVDSPLFTISSLRQKYTDVVEVNDRTLNKGTPAVYHWTVGGK